MYVKRKYVKWKKVNRPARFSAANLRQTAFNSVAWYSSAKARILETEFTDIFLQRRDSHINFSLSRQYLSAAANNLAISVSDTGDTEAELDPTLSTSSERVSLYIKCNKACLTHKQRKAMIMSTIQSKEHESDLSP